MAAQKAPEESRLKSLRESRLRAIRRRCQLYYKMDALPLIQGAKRLLDSAGVCDLGAGLIADARLIPGHIGNCIEKLTSSYISTTPFLDDLNFAGRSFTVRFWINITYTIQVGQSGGPSIVTLVNQGGTKYAQSLIVFSRPTGGDPDNEGRYRIFCAGDLGSIGVSSDLITWDQWRRVLIKFDLPNLLLSLRVDQETEATVAIPANWEWPDENFQVSTLLGTFTYLLDEVGVWPGYVWTAAEDAYDWNGGAGKTWPDVPMID